MKSVSFYPFTAQEVFMAKRKTPNHFLLRKVPKKKLDLKIVKVSRKKTETTDNKIYNVFFLGLERK